MEWESGVTPRSWGGIAPRIGAGNRVPCPYGKRRHGEVRLISALY
jgi:hypothetical protein